jgi:hypothetical protein
VICANSCPVPIANSLGPPLNQFPDVYFILIALLVPSSWSLSFSVDQKMRSRNIDCGGLGVVVSAACSCLLSALRINLWRLFANLSRIYDELERIGVLILFHQLQIGEPLGTFYRITTGKFHVC